MFRMTAVGGSVVFVVALLVGTGQSGDKKDTPPVPVKKFALPTYWKKLGLSDEQKKTYQETKNNYYAKIYVLQVQIDQLKKQETADIRKILNEDQRTMLRNLITKEVPDKKKDDDKKKEEDKK
jgi:hypothetical protein